jgi:TatA/E family protein of Tat protein translocase
MGSLGLPEIIFIMVLALLIFGPKRLPEIGRTLGKGMAEFRKATNDLKNTITTELTIEDEQPARPRRVDLASVTPIVTSPAARPLPAETLARDAQGAQEMAAAAAEASAAYDRAYGPAPSTPAEPAVVADAAPAVEPHRPIEPS